MPMPMLRTFALVCGVAVLPLNIAIADTASPAASQTYTPESGQAGKDVVWVPTPQALVDRMLEMGEITADDYVVDLGSGDGRTVISVAKLGARAHGIEYNPDLVALSKRNAEEAGVTGRATFVEGDIFESDFADADVVTLFLLPDLNLRLRPILLDMEPGTRVVSNSFHMGDWQADDQVEAGGGCEQWCRAYKWIVPAKVAGEWKVGDGELTLTQNFQMLSGTLERNGTSHTITDAKMDGTTISFNAGGTSYTGSVDGNTIKGTAGSGGDWSATRAEG